MTANQGAGRTVLLSNANGNFSVELPEDEARNVVAIQQPHRPLTSRMAMASMIGLAATAGIEFGGGRARRSSYAGEWCIECDAKMPPGKPRKCKACRTGGGHE